MASGKTIKEIEETKTQKIMNIIARKAAFYRANPHRFCELLNIHLRWFQKINLYAMMHYNYTMYFASRG